MAQEAGVEEIEEHKMPKVRGVVVEEDGESGEIEGMVVETRRRDGDPTQQTSRFPRYHHLLVLAVEAPLVFARPEMPKRKRARWRGSSRKEKRRKWKLKSASFVLRLSYTTPLHLATIEHATSVPCDCGRCTKLGSAHIVE